MQFDAWREQTVSLFGRFWRLEVFALGEVAEGVEAEEFEEALGGAVEDGAAGCFGAAGRRGEWG
jgi:hypothetical protein